MSVPPRHPGGRTCRKALPLAILMTLAVMIRHPVRTWRDTTWQ